MGEIEEVVEQEPKKVEDIIKRYMVLRKGNELGKSTGTNGNDYYVVY